VLFRADETFDTDDVVSSFKRELFLLQISLVGVLDLHLHALDLLVLFDQVDEPKAQELHSVFVQLYADDFGASLAEEFSVVEFLASFGDSPNFGNLKMMLQNVFASVRKRVCAAVVFTYAQRSRI